MAVTVVLIGMVYPIGTTVSSQQSVAIVSVIVGELRQYTGSDTPERVVPHRFEAVIGILFLIQVAGSVVIKSTDIGA